MVISPVIVANWTLLTGPLLISHLLNWGLFGALTVQVYVYYQAFPSDNVKCKSVVVFTYALEVIQLMLATSDAFRLFARGWGDPMALDDVGLYWLSLVIMTTLISFVCQSFYAWRILALSGNSWMAMTVCLTSVMQTGCGVYDGAMVRAVGHASELSTSIVFRASIIWSASSALCNLVITASMVYYLLRARKMTFRSTTSILTRLLIFTLETSILCAVVSVAALVCFIVSPATSLYTVPLMILSKLYSNSLLGVLNTRVKIIGGRDKFTTTSRFSSHEADSSLN
ncbi:hypothetical protein EIP91_005816 [Steccherinum ochraceum]|uniref:DUF6534 domain-containing protein n=1 Tax=Steccherinum ochraceum TaxID=92696 RepID=A0A4R0R6Q6_9APHY|nr:hypothetical protein EIP91_005816 [Steccherinum ochraceum]